MMNGLNRFRLLTVLVLSVSAVDAWALRCGNKLVSIGDHVVEVYKHCGQPVYEEQTTVVKTERYRAHRYHRIRLREREVLVRTLTYNFGPRRFMREIRVEDGVVRRIRHLDYGFRAKRSRF
ncbi:MAG: DUF2845 domain-containing protein [Pseudomonadota bacterium]